MTLNKDNTISTIIFISQLGKVKRVGNDKNMQEERPLEINEDEVPICIFGALKPIKG